MESFPEGDDTIKSLFWGELNPEVVCEIDLESVEIGSKIICELERVLANQTVQFYALDV